MKKLKVMTLLGTRPELIRLSRVIALLDKECKHILVHTGQNYDYELNEIFFKDLKLRKAGYYLGVDCDSIGKFLGETLIKIEDVILKEKPNAFLVLGDTNSSIGAVVAKRYRIPIYHMEAGNRSYDWNVPEEINRRLIDHISDFNLVYTENARRHLLSEGLPHRRVYITGSPMNEVLNFYKDGINGSQILDKLGLNKGKYFLVSVHREENVDVKENLSVIMDVLCELEEKYSMPVIVSTHPRTRKRLEEFPALKNSNLQFLKPFGFYDYNNLQKNSFCVISDSGTISEESSILNFNAVTIRQSMERPEALDCGSIVLTGLDKDNILQSIDLVTREYIERKFKSIPIDYQIEDTSWRVLKLILSTAKLSNKWDGIYNKRL